MCWTIGPEQLNEESNVQVQLSSYGVAFILMDLCHRTLHAQRIRLDCESEANYNLKRLLDKPVGSVE